MRYLVIICTISTLLFSCKKDKLEGDKSIFIGKWNWIKSDRTYNLCTGDPPSEETITPDTHGYNYSMEFLKKGIIKFYENDNSLDKNRIVFGQFNDGDGCSIWPGYIDFSINLDNAVNEITRNMEGCTNGDTLILIRGFPYQSEANSSCEKYTSYFIKQ